MLSGWLLRGGGELPGSPAPGSAGCPVARLARGWPALLVGPSPFHEELSTAFCRGPHAVARGPAAPEPLAFGIRSRSVHFLLRPSVPPATRAPLVSVTLRRCKPPSICHRRARIANAKSTPCPPAVPRPGGRRLWHRSASISPLAASAGATARRFSTLPLAYHWPPSARRQPAT